MFSALVAQSMRSGPKTVGLRRHRKLEGECRILDLPKGEERLQGLGGDALPCL